MKRFELVFNIISIFVDAAMLLLAATTAYILRFRAEQIFSEFPIIFELPYGTFIRSVLFALPVIIALLGAFGLYNLRSTRRFWSIFVRIIGGVSTGLMIFITVYFFDQEFFPSRLIVLMSWVFAIISVSLGRWILMIVEHAFLRRGYGLHRTVLVAEEGHDYGIKEQLENRPTLGYKLVSVINAPERIFETIVELQNTSPLDEIFYTRLDSQPGIKERLIRFAHDHGIVFNYVPDIVEAQRTNIEASDVDGIPLLVLSNTPLSGWGPVVKRVADIIISLVAIILTSPFFLIIAIGIKLDSKGRILFVQQRYGQSKPFWFYKFRTMYQHLSEGDGYGGAEAQKMRAELWKQNARGTGPFLKIKNDPRVTKFGSFLRSTKLDELPQLLNVLRGDMSLVGPRAHILEEVDKYREEYKRQFTIKPGLTGLGQISQLYLPDLAFDEEIRLNTFYIENWSLGLDFSIIMRTAWLLFFRPKREREYY